MLVTQAFRFELSPNEEQKRALTQHIGVARFVYNWGLERCKRALEEGKKIPSAYDLGKEWNQWKKENAPWWKEVSSKVPIQALRDLEQGLNKWRSKKSKFPRFKKKKINNDNKARFYGSIRVFPKHIQLPRIGKVKSKEPTDRLLRLIEEGKARIISATISQEADRFYVSLSCEVDREDPTPKEVKNAEDVVGIDLGLNSFAVLSNGEKTQSPKPLAKNLKLLKRRNKQFSRKQKGSNNQKKAALKLARLHRKIKYQRLDFLHKLTTELARTKPVLVIEDLNINGLMRGNLSRSVQDVGWGTFRRMLEYKTKWYGSTLIVAPRSFPSTRLCSRCGHLHGRIPLSQRIFKCEVCGLEIDRDLNASINLKKYGIAYLTGSTESSSESYACGDPSSGGTGLLVRSTSYGSLKQEVAHYQLTLDGGLQNGGRT